MQPSGLEKGNKLMGDQETVYLLPNQTSCSWTFQCSIDQRKTFSQSKNITIYSPFMTQQMEW